MRLITMRDALADPNLFGNMLPGESWAAWRALLTAAVGEELTPDERAVFLALTGRAHAPGKQAEEVWNIIGRRSGKTRAAAVLATYFAALVDHTDKLAPGERAVIPILAASTSQANKALSYIKGLFVEDQAPPLFKQMVTGETADTISLNTRIDVEVRPASFRTIRSITSPLAICDELAFWRSDNSANPDAEILNALRPALATMEGLLWVISSPHASKGELYENFRRDYGPDGDPLIIVAKAASRTMNGTLPERVVARAYERDPAVADAEFGGNFRNDVEGYVSRETLEALVPRGILNVPPSSSIVYKAFCDPSGGSRDSMTLAIGHSEAERAILDAVLEIKPPFSPDAAVEQFAGLLREYGVYTVRGDRYGGAWPADRFKAHGITYESAEKVKSDIYKECLPLFSSGRVQLLDNERLISQFVALERRSVRGGRDSIDHPKHAHDDLCNAAAGVLVEVSTRKLTIMDVL